MRICVTEILPRRNRYYGVKNRCKAGEKAKQIGAAAHHFQHVFELKSQPCLLLVKNAALLVTVNNRAKGHRNAVTLRSAVLRYLRDCFYLV